jgi:ABC-type sugar transport system ATPase subunit
MHSNNDSDPHSPESERPVGQHELMRATGVQKAFPGVQAIANGCLDLRAGEIHALVGENGAGKSTLIKVLTGAHQPDAGSMTVQGSKVSFSSPIDAHRAGIAAIYQEFSLIPNMSISANLFLGHERTHGGLLSIGEEHRRASEILMRLGTPLDPGCHIADLSVSEQQLVEIARALVADARILIMDEPTAALTPREVKRLFGVLGELVESGIGILFVSHRLDEVLEISDRITVMRDGLTLATRSTADMSRRTLIELMVGRPLEEEFPKGTAVLGPVRLAVRNLSGGKVHDISFEVRAGEILGIAGLMGAGRTELARLIFGADSRTSGHVLLNGQQVDPRNPRAAIHAGIGLLNEDRKGQGLVLCASASDNFALSSLHHWSSLGLLNLRAQQRAFEQLAQVLAIKVAGPEQRAETLSGGNQQKLLVARWLETNSQVIIFDEPTRGIDVGAKYEMYLIIRRLAAEGKAIILISSELPEILGMCDRVLIMRSGRLTGEIQNLATATQEQIMAMAV